MQSGSAIGAVTSDPFPASYSNRVRQIGVVNRKNRLITGIFSRLLDGPAVLRSRLIRKFIVEGRSFEEFMRDDNAAEEFIRKAVIGVWHASCSCRMGHEGDPVAVTDVGGRVRGVAGLRVVDASSFLVVPCGNTNIPVLMTAEKISEAILSEH